LGSHGRAAGSRGRFSPLIQRLTVERARIPTISAGSAGVTQSLARFVAGGSLAYSWPAPSDASSSLRSTCSTRSGASSGTHSRWHSSPGSALIPPRVREGRCVSLVAHDSVARRRKGGSRLCQTQGWTITLAGRANPRARVRCRIRRRQGGEQVATHSAPCSSCGRQPRRVGCVREGFCTKADRRGPSLSSSHPGRETPQLAKVASSDGASASDQRVPRTTNQIAP